VSLGRTAGTLRAEGVEVIGVVGTAADRARRYFSYRKPRYLVAADPDLASHRAFGVPHTAYTEEISKIASAKVDDLARESGHNVPAGGGWEALDREDEIQPNEFASDIERHQAQLTGQFLIDRDGVIRWSNIEAEREGLEGLDRFPSDDELLAAVHAL
jgi:hypothetical protein